MNYNHSDYWLDDFDWELEESNNSISNDQLLKLSSARKAIKNYVSILSGKHIPVIFNGPKSYTDGEHIVISSDIIDRKKFDINVGLTLHETSHIMLSDFKMLKNIWMLIPDDIHVLSENINLTKSGLIENISYVWNYIEDRYIDKYVTEMCPGYLPYYKALYKKYFDNATIKAGLKSDLYRQCTLESYLFRLVNMTNEYSDFSVLPGLKRIRDTIDLKNISRLKTPSDRLNCAFDVFKIILTKIDEFKSKNSNDDNLLDKLKQEFEEFEETTESSENNVELNENADLKKILGGEELSISQPSPTGVEKKDGMPSDLISDIGESNSKESKSKQKRIKNSFEKQKDLLTGRIRKKKIKASDYKKIKVLEENQVELIPVGSEFMKKTHYADRDEKIYTECIFAKSVTESFINDATNFPLSSRTGSQSIHQKMIDSGICLGNKIGRSLQIRNQEVIEKYTRKSVGKLDKKLLKDAAIGSDHVFYTTSCTKYKKTHFHIDLDMSSSMYGEKYYESLKLMTAIAKAFTMLNDVNLTIGMRTENHGHPYYSIVYNSTRDKFSKIKNTFRHLCPNGSTPEGLCFEAIHKFLSKIGSDTNRIFINISDGFPYSVVKTTAGDMVKFESDESLEYTRKQVNKIRELGYQIISYFITESSYNHKHGMSNFKRMYGDDAEFINTSNVRQITETLNKKLMETYTI